MPDVEVRPHYPRRQRRSAVIGAATVRAKRFCFRDQVLRACGRLHNVNALHAPRRSFSQTDVRGSPPCLRGRTDPREPSRHVSQANPSCRGSGLAVCPGRPSRLQKTGRGQDLHWAAFLAVSRVISMPPRNVAPSAIVTDGDVRSPSTVPFSRISTLLVAVMLPMTFPRTTTSLARI